MRAFHAAGRCLTRKGRPVLVKSYVFTEIFYRNVHYTQDIKMRVDGNQNMRRTSMLNLDENENLQKGLQVDSRQISSDRTDQITDTIQYGLVVQKHGGQLLVLPRGKDPRTQNVLILCSARARVGQAQVVVGDVVRYMQLPPTPDERNLMPQQQGVVIEFLPRRSVLKRPATFIATAAARATPKKSRHTIISTNHRNTQPNNVESAHKNDAVVSMSSSPKPAWRPLAANVDLLVAVTAAMPRTPPHSLDRLLVAAHAHGLDAAIVVNKVSNICGACNSFKPPTLLLSYTISINTSTISQF